MRVAGFDPGSRACGYGVVELTRGRLQSSVHGVWRLSGSLLTERLARLFEQCEELLARERPDAASIEIVVGGPSLASAVTLSEARGVLLLAAARASVPVFAYEPLAIKKSVTGFGKAGKPQVREMVRRLLPSASGRLALDASDALAAAICHCHHATAPTFDARRAAC